MPISDETRQRLLARSTRTADLIDAAHDDPEPNVFASVQYTGDLQEDCLREIEALLARCEARDTEDDPPHRSILDSRHYVVVCFVRRDDKDWFLIRSRLFASGNKYIGIDAFERAIDMLRRNGPATMNIKPRKDPRAGWDEAGLNANQRAFREAALKVKQTVEILGDTEYWFALCFRTAAAREEFLAAHPAQWVTQTAAYLDGYLLAEALGLPIPEGLANVASAEDEEAAVNEAAEAGE